MDGYRTILWSDSVTSSSPNASLINTFDVIERDFNIFDLRNIF